MDEWRATTSERRRRLGTLARRTVGHRRRARATSRAAAGRACAAHRRRRGAGDESWRRSTIPALREASVRPRHRRAMSVESSREPRARLVRPRARPSLWVARAPHEVPDTTVMGDDRAGARHRADDRDVQHHLRRCCCADCRSTTRIASRWSWRRIRRTASRSSPCRCTISSPTATRSDRSRRSAPGRR